MIKVTLWHEPEDFAFYIKDPSSKDLIGEDGSRQIEMHRFADRGRTVVVGVINEFGPIPITVEYDKDGLEPIDEDQWDRIVECSLESMSGAIVFESSYGDEFGRLDVQGGRYRLKICYGGQNTKEQSGAAKDYYLIQVWPCEVPGSRVIKPSESFDCGEEQ